MPESELQHPGVDLGMQCESLESSPLQQATAGRGPKGDYSESGFALVVLPDMESRSSKAWDPHYRDEHLVYYG